MSYKNENFNKKADEFLQRIEEYINLKFESMVTVRPAQISKINSDGTVDVFFPPDKNKIFTKIQNQSIYQDLKVGDQVFLFFPQKNQSSCWVCGKFKGGKVTFGIGNGDNKKEIVNYVEIDATGLAEIAKTGNANDLLQTPGDEIVINCGGAAR